LLGAQFSARATLTHVSQSGHCLHGKSSREGGIIIIIMTFYGKFTVSDGQGCILDASPLVSIKYKTIKSDQKGTEKL